MSKVSLRLYNLIRLLESKTGKRYSNKELLPLFGISKPTLYRYMNGDTDNISLTALGLIIDFFESEGMRVTPNQMFEVTEDTTQDDTPNPNPNPQDKAAD